MKLGKTFIALALAASLAVLPGCSQWNAADSNGAADAKGAAPAAGDKADPKAAPAKPPAPVKVAQAEIRSMPDDIENIASVESISTVEVKAQVSGEVIEVLFKEGDMVNEGQELFRLDARPYEAALKQLEAKRARAVSMQAAAQAEVARNQAQASNMRTELQRNKTLLDKEFVTQAEYDTARMQADASQAGVNAAAASVASAGDDIRAAEADIERAKLDLGYCVIKAPITGRTGSLLIHKGDIVKANDAGAMVTIAQMKPIYVTFTLAEKYLSELRMRMQEGAVPVSATVPSVDHAPAMGELTFVDNSVDRMTSTIRLKATFPNDDELLWPGQYVRASVQMSVLKDAIVVPDQALQSGQKGPYVYVVGGDMKAEMRPVKPGISKDGLLVVTEGLKAGESVVIDGQMRTAPGATVSIVTGETTPDGAAKPDAGEGSKPAPEAAKP